MNEPKHADTKTNSSDSNAPARGLSQVIDVPIVVQRPASCGARTYAYWAVQTGRSTVLRPGKCACPEGLRRLRRLASRRAVRCALLFTVGSHHPIYQTRLSRLQAQANTLRHRQGGIGTSSKLLARLQTDGVMCAANVVNFRRRVAAGKRCARAARLKGRPWPPQHFASFERLARIWQQTHFGGHLQRDHFFGL